MNICLVSQEYPPESTDGGIGTQTWVKATGLVRAGHTVHVLSVGGEDAPPLATKEADGVIVHRMRPPCADFAVYDNATYLLGYTWHVLGALSKLMETVKFDVLDFPEYGFEGVAYQIDRTVWNFVPTVVELHGSLGMFADRFGWPEKGSPFHRLGTSMEALSITQADVVMSCSASIAGVVSRDYGVPLDAIQVVHAGVDAEMFSPAPDGAWPMRPTIVFAGKIVENKGVHHLVEAVLRLRKKYPEVLLRVFGSSRRGLAETLKERVAAEHAEYNFDFAGFVDFALLPEHYRRATVVCMPSEYEALGNVYLEGMACGKPVIGSSAGGGSEAIVDGETGFTVPPNDLDALTAALDRVLGDVALQKQMGAAGRRCVEDYWTTEKFIARILAVYEKAAAIGKRKLDRMKIDCDA
jgi:glycosyltransferase involved in cell wall biosynthesis